VNVAWNIIKNNNESKLKERCRNIQSEAYQELERFEETVQIINHNLETHNRSIKDSFYP
jgi:hypothetical protein